MPGFMPGIHVFFCGQDVDGGNKSGHDDRLAIGDPVRLALMLREGLTIATAIAISTPPGTSGLLAFGREKTDDGIDTIERRP